MPKGKKFDEPLSPIAVANYLLQKGDALSPLKLVKLVYLCHGWHSGLGQGPLLSESPQAWRNGPVVPSLYYAVREFGDSPVKGPIDEGSKETTGDIAKPTKKQAEVIDAVYNVYAPLSATQLSTITHQEKTPWHKVWQKKKRNVPIPDGLIRDHFEGKLNGTQAA